MSPSSDTLDSRFGLPGQVRFRTGPDELVFAEIDNPHASASVCLQGAHLVTWRPKAQAEAVIWVSEAARYARGKSIRGGVPVCWPWFGPHATESGFPAHGYARTVMWEVISSQALEDGATELALMLLQNEQTRALFPHACRLELVLTVGERLRVELVTTNLDTEAIEIGEALHTYFRIGDIGQVRVLGLEGCEYVDKVDGGARKRQEGAITFQGEVDRVYLNTAAECVIEDPVLRRRIHIAKSGSLATVVWTPWLDKAQKMGDFGPGRAGRGGWREMVCVESGNALDDVVSVPAGGTHRLTVDYWAEPL